MSKKTRNIIISVAVLLVLIAAAVGIYFHFAPQPQDGTKTICVSVIHGDESQKDFSYKTDAETLREALEPEGLIAGDESEFGLFVKTVDGETADDSLEQWWCVTKGGEMTETGVDGIMIADGDSYEFTLKTGW